MWEIIVEKNQWRNCEKLPRWVDISTYILIYALIALVLFMVGQAIKKDYDDGAFKNFGVSPKMRPIEEEDFRECTHG